VTNGQWWERKPLSVGGHWTRAVTSEKTTSGPNGQMFPARDPKQCWGVGGAYMIMLMMMMVMMVMMMMMTMMLAMMMMMMTMMMMMMVMMMMIDDDKDAEHYDL